MLQQFLKFSLPSSFCLRKACPPRAAEYPQEVGTLPVPIGIGESMSPLRLTLFTEKTLQSCPYDGKCSLRRAWDTGGEESPACPVRATQSLGTFGSSAEVNAIQRDRRRGEV